MQRFLGLLFVSLFFLPTAKASLLIEPLVGYSLSTKVDIKKNNSLGLTGEEYSGGMGPSFGGRLGYQKLGFQVGLDYLHSTIDMDDKDFADDVTMNEWAAFVGFEFPILVRVYAGYIFSADAESKSDGTPDEKMTFKDGTGAKVGVGFTLLPFLDINLEYRRGTFSEWKVGPTKVDSEVDYSSYMIALSLPFTL